MPKEKKTRGNRWLGEYKRNVSKSQRCDWEKATQTIALSQPGRTAVVRAIGTGHFLIARDLWLPCFGSSGCHRQLPTIPLGPAGTPMAGTARPPAPLRVPPALRAPLLRRGSCSRPRPPAGPCPQPAPPPRRERLPSPLPSLSRRRAGGSGASPPPPREPRPSGSARPLPPPAAERDPPAGTPAPHSPRRARPAASETWG